MGRPPQSNRAIEPDQLTELAISLGAGAAMALDVEHVSAEDRLAGLCKESRCENYGLSPTCPPHVRGPAWLRDYMGAIDRLLLIKLELPSEAMYSDQRREIGKLLHFIVIQAEYAAKGMGLEKSMAFAGGSCKKLFCPDKANCRVLHGDGVCRNPDSARPSVSGFGINMNRLLKAAGWDKPDPNGKANERLSAFYGLLLLG